MPGSSAIPLRGCLPLAVMAQSLLLVVVARAQAPEKPGQLSLDLDLPSYEAELDRCAAAVKQPGEMDALRKSLPRVWFVRTPDGGRVNVSTAWLSQRFEKLDQGHGTSTDEVRGIESRLGAMRRAATELESASTQPFPRDARDRFERILRRREFAGEHGPSQLDLLKARISRWITEQILKLFSHLHLGAAAGNALAWTIVGLAFLALCLWVFRSLTGRSRLVDTSTAGAAEATDSRLWAKEALAAAERGDYREAVHCAYWAAVVHLESLGLLKHDHARTPRESLRLLDPHPNEQKLLREFTYVFELIWYGYRPASAADWRNARAHLEKMGCLIPLTAATANS
jgi:hypothetical protein